MKGKTKFGVGVVCAILCLAASQAQAGSPVFGIHTEQDWGEALNSGRIQPVPAEDFETMVQGDDNWPDVYKNAQFYTPELQVFPDYLGEAGLYMAWGEDGGEAHRAAAWDYIYDADPNLQGTTIDFSILPPVYCTHFSLNLIDQNGNYREWIWHVGDPGEIPPGQWSTLSINPVTGGSNYATVALFTHDVPGTPFDLSTIQILRFNENISSTPGFPPGPMGNVPNGWVWNAWNHVQVSPEPGTLLVWTVLAGLATALGWRRRRH